MKTALKNVRTRNQSYQNILLYNLMLDIVLIYVLLLLKLINKFAEKLLSCIFQFVGILVCYTCHGSCA